MFWCIIWPLLAAIIGGILGWLLKSLFCNCDDEKKEIENLKAKSKKLQAELDTCLKGKKELSVNVSSNTTNSGIATGFKSVEADLSSGFAAASTLAVEGSTEPKLVFNAGLAKSIFGKKIIGDDLKVVEGIGPKISELFNDNGVKTWYQLSKTPIERCQEILNIGGKRFEIHKPDTWPMQAGLAFEGKWKELLKLQDELDGGKIK